MKGNRALVAAGRDCLESGTAGGPRVFLEGLIEHFAHAAPAIIRVNADQVDVARFGRARCHETEKESDQDAIVFYDARHRPELVKENRMRERRRRTAPPAIDDL